MKITENTRIIVLATLLGVGLFSGCGTNTSSNSVPTTEAVYYATSVLFSNHSTLFAAGNDAYGQMGNGDIGYFQWFRPVSSAGSKKFPKIPNSFKSVASGANHTIAFTNSSTVWEWGCNFEGRLGLSTLSIPSVAVSGGKAYSPVPVPVSQLPGGWRVPGSVQQVAAGWKYSMMLAVPTDGVGRVWAWGGNSYGELGDFDLLEPATAPLYLTDQVLPQVVRLPANANIKEIAAGSVHGLARDDQGNVYGWGSNLYQQVGKVAASPTGTGNSVLTPVLVPGVSNIQQIAAAGSYSLALGYDGKVYSWGYNQFGQLGQGEATATKLGGIGTPAPVVKADGTPLTGVTTIRAGQSHALALDDNGTVWVWGFGQKGQLGTDPTGKTVLDFRAYAATVPALDLILNFEDGKPLTTPKQVVDIYAFGNMCYARILDPNNPVALPKWYGWGDNSWGQLGQVVPTNDVANKFTPVELIIP